MNDSNPSSPIARPRRQAWNKGKLAGPKPPLRPGHVWSIRARLQLERHARDLALFNLAIDSKLRGCDLVALGVDDVAPNGCRPGDGPAEENGSVCPVRADAHTAGARRLSASERAETGSMLVPGPAWPRSASDYSAVCSSRRQMDQQHRPGPTEVRDAFHAAHKGDFDLAAHGEPTRCPTFARAPKN